MPAAITCTTFGTKAPEEARTITVQLIPADAARRIDAADPGNCPF